MEQGMIRKALSGFYYVHMSDGRTLECRAKGIFRKDGITPLVGDRVEVEDETVARILPRRNEMLRPPIANVDLGIMVVSADHPQPNTFVLDKLIAICESKGIEPVLIFTKTDLADCGALAEVYRSARFSVFFSSPDDGNYQELLSLMAHKLSVFIGNSGVGKSTLMNALIPGLTLATAQISQKLGRGRHTTRHVELYDLPNGALVADTPGFSSVEVLKYGRIRKEELASCFREFSSVTDGCRFLDCSHRVEKGCSLLEAVKNGTIANSRHESYQALYEEAMQVKEWEVREEEKRR